jgi:hypothetical protein
MRRNVILCGRVRWYRSLSAGHHATVVSQNTVVRIAIFAAIAECLVNPYKSIQ